MVTDLEIGWMLSFLRSTYSRRWRVAQNQLVEFSTSGSIHWRRHPQSIKIDNEQIVTRAQCANGRRWVEIIAIEKKSIDRAISIHNREHGNVVQSNIAHLRSQST